jgi:hypothetical protein
MSEKKLSREVEIEKVPMAFDANGTAIYEGDKLEQSYEVVDDYTGKASWKTQHFVARFTRDGKPSVYCTDAALSYQTDWGYIPRWATIALTLNTPTDAR